MKKEEFFPFLKLKILFLTEKEKIRKQKGLDYIEIKMN